MAFQICFTEVILGAPFNILLGVPFFFLSVPDPLLPGSHVFLFLILVEHL